MARAIRFYETEQQAQAALDELNNMGIPDNMVVLLAPSVGTEESAVRAAIAKGRLPGSQINAATAALRKGRTLLSVELPYGAGQRVEDILESHQPVDTDSLVSVPELNPAPLSDFLGIPTLLGDGASRTRLMKGPKNSSFGFPLLTRGGRPMFGAVKTFRKNSSMGLPLLSKNPAPLSSMFKLKLLSGRR